MGRLTMLQAAGQLVPSLAVVCGTVLAGVTPDGLDTYGPYLFLASAVVLGLPHGAVDHLVIARFEGESVFSAPVLTRLALYVAAVLATLAVWWAAPVAVFAGFIALTLFHWGQGDVWFHREAYGIEASASGVLLAGGLPMLVPLVAFPETYAAVAEAFAQAAGVHVSLQGHIETLAPFAATLLVGGAAVRVWRAAANRVAVAAETAFLALFFAVVPPIAAIAIYFCFWHAPRHLVRLSRTLYGRGGQGFGRTLVAAVPLTLVSLCGLAGLLAITGRDDTFSVYLALIAALTVPHVGVVSWMDLRDRVWSRVGNSIS